MPPVQIFISYRRDDTAGYARAICDDLAHHFGAERVFMDVDDIGAGQGFADAIRRAVGESRALLVLIGPRWRGERAGRPPRIDDEDDFVRLEVTAALAGGMRVIPLLIDGAAMPSEAELPTPLRPLAQRNALEIGGTRFRADMDRLVATLRSVLEESAPPTRRTVLAWAAAAVACAGALLAYRQFDAPSGVGTRAPAPRPDVNGEWQAEVTYDWPNARYPERFVFAGEAGELHGSASFLRVPRGILEGRIDAAGLTFVTRTRETADAGDRSVVHRYRGRLDGDAIRFVMQTEGAGADHLPVEFVARRADPAAPPSVSR